MSVLISFSLLGMGSAFSQPVTKEETEPQIILGNITSQMREIESAPSSIKILEVFIEIINRSQKMTAPPNSIKVVLTPKEAKFPDGTPVDDFTSPPEEVMINLPLAPRTGQVVMIGFPLPEKKLGSISFDIQVNPPEGEKRTVSFNL